MPPRAPKPVFTPHTRPAGPAAVAYKAAVATCSDYALDAESSEAHQRLEALDDAMFAAIDGNADALEKARALWLDSVCVLPLAVIEESREQYLRYAAEVTRRYGAHDLRNPATAIVALEIFDLLSRD